MIQIIRVDKDGNILTAHAVDDTKEVQEQREFFDLMWDNADADRKE